MQRSESTRWGRGRGTAQVVLPGPLVRNGHCLSVPAGHPSSFQGLLPVASPWPSRVPLRPGLGSAPSQRAQQDQAARAAEPCARLLLQVEAVLQGDPQTGKSSSPFLGLTRWPWEGSEPFPPQRRQGLCCPSLPPWGGQCRCCFPLGLGLPCRPRRGWGRRQLAGGLCTLGARTRCVPGAGLVACAGHACVSWLLAHVPDLVWTAWDTGTCGVCGPIWAFLCILGRFLGGGSCPASSQPRSTALLLPRERFSQNLTVTRALPGGRPEGSSLFPASLLAFSRAAGRQHRRLLQRPRGPPGAARPASLRALPGLGQPGQGGSCFLCPCCPAQPPGHHFCRGWRGNAGLWGGGTRATWVSATFSVLPSYGNAAQAAQQLVGVRMGLGWWPQFGSAALGGSPGESDRCGALVSGEAAHPVGNWKSGGPFAGRGGSLRWT